MIVISCTCDKVNLNQSIMWIDWRSFILFGKFNLITCNVCKNLIKGSHNLSINVKVAKNVRGPSCQILQINSFLTFQNNHVNHARFSNHDNLGMIWKYYLNLVYIALEKNLRFYNIVSLSYWHPTQTYDFLDEDFNCFKNKVWNIGWKISRFMK
jgi:hypothetical protein